MNVSADPRNCTLTKGAIAVSSTPPKTSIHRKSALRLRKDPSSSDLEYLIRK